MRKFIIPIIIAVVSTTACTEKFDFEFDENVERIVVDAVLTNFEGTKYNYVRLTKTQNKPTQATNQTQVIPVIKDAVIKISDNLGNSETLRYTETYENMRELGSYKIEHLRAVAGRTYTLEITWQGKTYKAVSRVKSVPQINRIGFRSKYLEAKKETVTIPLLYFNEPQNTKDYYLLHYTIDGFSGSNRNWGYSILNDVHLTAQVRGIEIDDGQSASGTDFYHNIPEGSEVKVYLESLTEEAYEFYRSIIKQFESDGGAFSQAPATPAGNISNGALGLFRCSSVSEKTVIRQ
ncbi:MAG: DUF4249 domain-containing protein [Bacteroidales bacterium]|nr:DUF4249 domain-containing protein [Bacteroidales bacterium]